MDGTIAIIGFWIFVIAIVMRKPLITYLERGKKPVEIESRGSDALTERVQQLEGIVSKLTDYVSELKDGTAYAQQMLIESAQKLDEAQNLLLESSEKTQMMLESMSQEAGVRLIEAGPPPESLGTVVSGDTIRFERSLQANIADVWRHFTEPELLRKWLASQATLENKTGGRVELAFDGAMQVQQKSGSRIIGLVKAFEPVQRLAFSWMDIENDLDSAVSIELHEDADGTALVLNHSRLPHGKMHEFMAFWHAHLDVLAARLANIVPPDFNARFHQVVHKYAAIVASTVVVSSTAFATMPAADAANNLDANSYQSVKAERSGLMKQYDLLWRDVDEHQKRVDMLKRDRSLESQRELDQLDRQLEDEYRDLHQLEIQIKDMDRVLN